MTIDEMRKRLTDFCNDRCENGECFKCPVREFNFANCIFKTYLPYQIKLVHNTIFGGEEMTIEEMRMRLKDHCDAQKGCRECPLGQNTFEDCAFDDYPDEAIEDYYNIVFDDEKEEINHPDRYAGGKFECIDVMLDVFGADAVKHFCILNAFKYLWKLEKKNGIEDIKKAVFYLNYYVNLMEDNNETSK